MLTYEAVVGFFCVFSDLTQQPNGLRPKQSGIVCSDGTAGRLTLPHGLERL